MPYKHLSYGNGMSNKVAVNKYKSVTIIKDIKALYVYITINELSWG